MAISQMESVFNRVAVNYCSILHDLTDIKSVIAEEPDLVLSHVLFGLTDVGRGPDSEKAIPAAVALELLDQALKLGADEKCDQRPERDESNLLATDFLYAQAIDQVISLNRPMVIKILASSIMDTAADRSMGDYSDHRRQLVTAALRIGACLWEINGAQGEAIERAAEACGTGTTAGWIDLLPACDTKVFLRGGAMTAEQSL